MKSNASKILIISLLLVVAVSGVLGFFDIQAYAQAQSTPYYNGSYYDGVNASLKGNSMYNELANLITSTHKKLTNYDDDLKAAFKVADADPNNSNNVINFYTGTSSSASKMFSGGVNREHVWPKDSGKAFPAESRAGSDAHHLRPCDTSLNSTRSNKSFDEVEQTTSARVAENGSTSYGDSSNPDSYCYTSSSFFYPAEGYRGATARILLYMYVRWGTEYNLTFVDSAGNCKTIGKISTLMKWHYQEPPTDEEIRRNDAVYQIQGNRNPFIDHPEWATTIICDSNQSYSSACKTVAEQYDKYDEQGGEDSSTPVTEIVLDTNSITLAVGQTQQISASVNPSEASQKVEFSSNNTSVATVDGDGVVTAKGSGSATITVKSAVSEIRNYVTVTVKQATAITLSGMPSKTTYFAGQKFDASGLTITVTYDDNSTGTLQATDCLWLDANTQAETLSQGTTSVICKYGNLTATVSGITVGQAQEQTVTIELKHFDSGTGYAFHSFESDNGEVTGRAYIYPNDGNWQFNSNKSYEYLFGQTPQAIKSITVYTASGYSKQWEVRTNSSAYNVNTSNYPTDGASYGKKTVTSSGTTWDLSNNENKYFTLNYVDSSVCYLQKIEITYGGSSGGEVTPPVNDSVTLDKSTHSMQTTDTVTLNATASGEVVWSSSNTNVATVSNGVVTAIGKGTATITATCGTAKATCVVTVTQKPCQTHIFGDWIVDKQPTCQTEGSHHKECTICGEKSTAETIAKIGHAESDWKIDKQATCQQTGSKHTECVVCHQTLQTEQIPLANHVESDWLVDKQPTCKEEGARHKECTLCGQITTPAQAIAKTENHNFGSWQTTICPTPTANGSQTRECQVCGKTETRQIEYAGEVDDFIQAVNALQNATTLEEKYQAICNAVNIYNSYSAEQKQQVESQFATLKGYVESYNQQVSQINQTSQDALKVVVSSLCWTSVAVALWYLLKKRV